MDGKPVRIRSNCYRSGSGFVDVGGKAADGFSNY